MKKLNKLEPLSLSMPFQLHLIFVNKASSSVMKKLYITLIPGASVIKKFFSVADEEAK
jgi:hypothetical protein